MSNWKIHDEIDWRILSEDGKNVLTRWCIVHYTNDRPTKTMIAIGINPSGKTLSSQDNTEPDSVSMTARRLRSFANKANCDRIVLFNIFPQATASVSSLAILINELEREEKSDSICEENVCKINSIMNQLALESSNTIVLLCYGRGIRKHVKLEMCRNKILSKLSSRELPMYYLDLTSDNIPRHPNSCKKDSKFKPCSFINGELKFEETKSE